MIIRRGTGKSQSSPVAQDHLGGGVTLREIAAHKLGGFFPVGNIFWASFQIGKVMTRTQPAGKLVPGLRVLR